MSRMVGAEIEVWMRDRRPVAFAWRGRTYSVRWIVDHWVALCDTWCTDAETVLPHREHWRIHAGSANGEGVYELSHHTSDDTWSLVRVWD